MYKNILLALSLFSPVFAGPVGHVLEVVVIRAVKALDQKATAEAHPRDDTAVRAFSGTQIKTSDGKCLFVDELSGDFRANLTPIQVAACGSTKGQGWDIITKGAHNNVANSMLIVNTLTGACANFDSRRRPGDQVNLFSCGGRADGSGKVTNSQLFAFNGQAGPLSLKPLNSEGSCLTVQGNVVGIEACAQGNANQNFAFGQTPIGNNSVNAGGRTQIAKASSTAINTATPTKTATSTAAPPAISAFGKNVGKGDDIPNPTEPVPVSRGGLLNPTAVAEAQAFDKTADRVFQSVTIQSSYGRCLAVDPTAGDFRENLIPVSLVKCQGSLNEKFDVVTAGKHNDGTHGKSALVVSVLTNGCITFDGRRPLSDQVNMFSCGGRADGSGQTSTGQLFPFDGEKTIEFQPVSENKAVCLKGFRSDHLVAGTCNGRPSRTFKILFI